MLQQGDATVDDGLVELEVRNTIAKQSASCFILVEDGNLVAHEVQVVGGCKSSRSGTDDSDLLTIALRLMYCDISFSESRFSDSRFILSIGSWLVFDEV